jgi:NaMN:DMB phosphoribosyltransferase
VPPVPGLDTPSDGGRLLGVGIKQGSRDLLALATRDRGRWGDIVVALGEVEVGNTTVAAAFTAAVLGVQPAAAVDLGAGADTELLDRKLLTLAAALHRAHDRYGDELLDPLVVLSALGRPEFTVLTGVALGAAEGGAVIVLDRLATSVAALIATRLAQGVAAHMIAGRRSREVAHGIAVHALSQNDGDPLTAHRPRLPAGPRSSGPGRR